MGEVQANLETAAMECVTDEHRVCVMLQLVHDLSLLRFRRTCGANSDWKET